MYKYTCHLELHAKFDLSREKSYLIHDKKVKYNIMNYNFKYWHNELVLNLLILTPY